MPQLTLTDLAIAYRKAKVDLWYSSDSRPLDLLAYEEDLEANLRRLLVRLNGRTGRWVEAEEYLGGFALMPKQVRSMDRADGGLHWSDPAKAWDEAVGREGQARPVAEFRLMARCSIDLHVLSTAWMMTAGGRLEYQLSKDSMGSRLRRNRRHEVNRLAPGSFKHYLTPYRSWRDGGLRAVESALDDKKAVVVLTADATSYYHRVDPSFLLDSGFLSHTIGVEFDQHESRINRVFVNLLQALVSPRWRANRMACPWLARRLACECCGREPGSD